MIVSAYLAHWTVCFNHGRIMRVLYPLSKAPRAWGPFLARPAFAYPGTEPERFRRCLPPGPCRLGMILRGMSSSLAKVSSAFCEPLHGCPMFARLVYTYDLSALALIFIMVAIYYYGLRLLKPCR